MKVFKFYSILNIFLSFLSFLKSPAEQAGKVPRKSPRKTII